MSTQNPDTLMAKIPDVMTKSLRVVMSGLLIVLSLILIVAASKIMISLVAIISTESTVVPYALAEQIVMFFLYFGFLGLIVQYFKSGYHFPMRYFIYAGITAMVRLIIVDHDDAMNTLLFALSILVMVISLLLTLYSDKLKNL